MAPGLSGRGKSGFDFASDDVLCSYEDNGNHDSSNGCHSDPVVGSKEFHKMRVPRPSAFPPRVYNQQEDSFSQDVMSAVEQSMKKYADNLMRFLEGMSSRLSQLELYCYNLDKSIGEMRNELGQDNGEADSKLQSIEKHLQEVHRSVQILRDKQELAETQKKLAKLQLARKESNSSSHSQSNEERTSSPASDFKKSDNASEVCNQQLALALPHQIAPRQQTVMPLPAPSQAPQSRQQSYYLPPAQLPSLPSQTQHTQSPYIPNPQCSTHQLQDTRMAPQLTRCQINQTVPAQSFPHYQQQWPQQLPPQVAPSPPPPPQPSVQTQIRPPQSTVYSPYPANQPAGAAPPATQPKSMPMQVSYSGVPQSASDRVVTMPYSYGVPGRTVQQPQPPPQQMKGTFGGQQGDGYMASGPHPALPPGSAYMMYDNEGMRPGFPQPPHHQSGYTPANVPLSIAPPQPPTGSSLMIRNASTSQFFRGHQYAELIDKLVSMGFRGDHVAGVIQRMEDSGQPVDFNSVLDRLNVPSGTPHRAW